MNYKGRALGGFYGLAVADILGAQVEFKQTGTFPPVTSMVGGGPLKLCILKFHDLIICISKLCKKCWGHTNIRKRCIEYNILRTSVDVIKLHIFTIKPHVNRPLKN